MHGDNHSEQNWSSPIAARLCECSPLGYCRYVAGGKIGESRCWLRCISCLDGLNCFPTKCWSKGKERLPLVLLKELRGKIRGKKYIFRKRCYLSRKEGFSGTGTHSQCTSVLQPEGTTLLHPRYTEDRSTSTYHSSTVQGIAWPVHAGLHTQCPGFPMEGAAHVLHMEALAPTNSYTVRITSGLRKVWSSLPGHKVQPDSN